MRAARRPNFRLAALALGAVGALHGLVYVPFAGPRLGDTPAYEAAAHAIRSGSYSTPLPDVDVTGHPIPESAQGAPERQTYRTPGFPLLLAATGYGGDRPLALIVVQALLTGAGVWLLALTARRLWSERAGLLAGALAALDPFPKHYVPRILSEALAGFLVAASAYAFVRAWQSRSPAWWAAAGLASAALTLTRPLFGLAVPLALVAALLRPRRLLAAGAYLAAAALLLGPWIAWEQDVAGRATLSSFGEGWNLLIAAHGEGLHRTAVEVERSPAYVRDFRSVHRFAPSAAALRRNPEAHPHYLARADAEQRRLAGHLYRKRLGEEPVTLLGEVAYRGYFLWMAHEDWAQPGWLLPLLRAADWLSLALAAAGAALALRLGGAGRALALFLVAFTLVNAVHHVEARYAMPVRGLYAAFVALALVTLGGLGRQRRQTQRGDPERRAGDVAG